MSPYIDIYSFKDTGFFSVEKLLEFAESLKDGKYGTMYRAKGFFRLPEKTLHIDWVMNTINYKEHKDFNSDSVLTVLGDVIYKEELDKVLKKCLLD